MKKIRIAAVMLGAMVVLGVTATVWADQQFRLRASINKRINGFEAELRGDYRERSAMPDRLNAELEKLNLPIGTKVAFCLVQNGTKSLIGVAQVQNQAGIPVAEVELESRDGDHVPNVNAGDILQARQHATAPFLETPGCSSALLVAAPFQK